MVLDAALAYLHYISIMLVAGFLSSELYLLKSGLDSRRLALLVRADALYCISSIVALGSGLARAFWGLKGIEYFLSNPLFHLKTTLYVVVAVLSLVPTLRYMRWRKAGPDFVPSQEEQATMRRIVMIELHLLALLPLCAVALARGFRTLW